MLDKSLNLLCLLHSSFVMFLDLAKNVTRIKSSKYVGKEQWERKQKRWERENKKCKAEKRVEKEEEKKNRLWQNNLKDNNDFLVF